MDHEDVKLQREVYRQDVERLANWMADEVVVEHLNEEQNVARKLQNLLAQSQLPLFSPHFNRDGCFFLITLPEEGPIGFLRLVPKQDKAEIVVVIGERRHWGKGYGYQAIRKGVRHAFFELRKEKVVATIRKDNQRSRKVFRQVGFTKAEELSTETRFTLPVERFAQH